MRGALRRRGAHLPHAPVAVGHPQRRADRARRGAARALRPDGRGRRRSTSSRRARSTSASSSPARPSPRSRSSPRWRAARNYRAGRGGLHASAIRPTTSSCSTRDASSSRSGATSAPAPPGSCCARARCSAGRRCSRASRGASRARARWRSRRCCGSTARGAARPGGRSGVGLSGHAPAVGADRALSRRAGSEVTQDERTAGSRGGSRRRQEHTPRAAPMSVATRHIKGGHHESNSCCSLGAGARSCRSPLTAGHRAADRTTTASRASPVKLMVGYQPYYTQSWSGRGDARQEVLREVPAEGLRGRVPDRPAGRDHRQQHAGRQAARSATWATCRRSCRPPRPRPPTSAWWPTSASATTSATSSSRATTRRSSRPPKDVIKWLDGKIVAVPKGSCTDRFAQATFKKENVNPKEYLNQNIEVITSQLPRRQDRRGGDLGADRLAPGAGRPRAARRLGRERAARTTAASSPCAPT